VCLNLLDTSCDVFIFTFFWSAVNISKLGVVKVVRFRVEFFQHCKILIFIIMRAFLLEEGGRKRMSNCLVSVNVHIDDNNSSVQS